MTVSVNVPMLPAQGLLGPPKMMIANASLVGDVSLGSNQISVQMQEGFLWMPLFASVALQRTGAANFRAVLQFIDQQLPVYIPYSQIFRLAAVAADQVLRESFNLPRMLFKSGLISGVPPELQVTSTNTNLETMSVSFAALRWEKNALPANWQAFLVSPP